MKLPWRPLRAVLVVLVATVPALLPKAGARGEAVPGRDGYFGAWKPLSGCYADTESLAQFDSLANAYVGFTPFGGGQEWKVWEPDSAEYLWDTPTNCGYRMYLMKLKDRGFKGWFQFKSAACWGTNPDSVPPGLNEKTSLPAKDLSTTWTGHGYSSLYYDYVTNVLDHWHDVLAPVGLWTDTDPAAKGIIFREEPINWTAWCGANYLLPDSTWACKSSADSNVAKNVGAYMRMLATVTKAAHDVDPNLSVYACDFNGHIYGLGICADAIDGDLPSGWPDRFPHNAEQAVKYYNSYYSWRPDSGLAWGAAPYVADSVALAQQIKDFFPTVHQKFVAMYMDSLGRRYKGSTQNAPPICDGLNIHYMGNYWHFRDAIDWLRCKGLRSAQHALPNEYAAMAVYVPARIASVEERIHQDNDWCVGLPAASEVVKLLTVARAETLGAIAFYKFDRPTDSTCTGEYDGLALALMDHSCAHLGWADTENGVGARDAYFAYKFLAGTITSEYADPPTHTTKADTIHEYWFTRDGYDDRFNVGAIWYGDTAHVGGPKNDTIDVPLDIGVLERYNARGTLEDSTSADITEYSFSVSDTARVIIFRGLDSLRITSAYWDSSGSHAVSDGDTIHIVRGTHLKMEATGYYTDREGQTRERVVSSDVTWAVDSLEANNFDLRRNVLTYKYSGADTTNPTNVNVTATLDDVSDTFAYHLVKLGYGSQPTILQSLTLVPGDTTVVLYRPSKRTAQDPLPLRMTANARYANPPGIDINRTIEAHWSLLTAPGGNLDSIGRYTPPADASLPFTVRVSAKVLAGGFTKADTATYVFSGSGGFMKSPPVGGSLPEPRVYAYRPPVAVPNPAVGRVAISFTLPGRSDGSEGNFAVLFEIFDVQGRLVRALPALTLHAGEQRISWDGRNGRGVQVPTGIYFARLVARGAKAEEITATQKIILMR